MVEWRSSWEELRALNEELSADDPPLWAQVVMPALVFGLTLRGGCHVWSALIQDVDPQLADNDVSTGNAVAALRDCSIQEDLTARALAFGVGVLLWTAILPLRWETPLGVVMAANLFVLIGEPLWFLLFHLRHCVDR